MDFKNKIEEKEIEREREQGKKHLDLDSNILNDAQKKKIK